MINISKIYGITIERSTKRWDQLEKDVIESDLDIKLQKIIGIDGTKILMTDIKEECSDLTKNFFITHEMYGKCKSHLLLWNEIIKTNPKEDEYFMILEDDVILPKNFKDYIKKLNEFLNKIPKDILDKTDIFNLSPGGDYCTSKNLNQNIMTFITNIISLILSKKKTKNEVLFEENDYKVLNSNFPLCTHAYLVNTKQLKKLISSFEKNKITYHLDIYLNIEHFNINTIIPIEIKRGGFSDSTSALSSNPKFPVQILTMFDKELACDLGRPLVNIFGFYPVNILIIVSLIFLCLWQFIDIPGRLQEFFTNI